MTQNKKLNFKIGLLAILTLLVFGIGCFLAYTTNANKVYADYEDLSGDTIVNFNQLSLNINISISFASGGNSEAGFYYQNGSTSSGDFASSNMGFSNLDSSHKYYYKMLITDYSSNVSHMRLYFNSYARTLFLYPEGNGTYYGIVTGLSSYDLPRLYKTDTNAATFTLTWQFIDLSLMYGVGNEPSLAQCQEIFTAEYYFYNTGTTLTLNGVDAYQEGVSDTLASLNYTIAATDSYNNLSAFTYNGTIGGISDRYTQTTLPYQVVVCWSYVSFAFNATVSAGTTMHLTGYFASYGTSTDEVLLGVLNNDILVNVATVDVSDYEVTTTGFKYVDIYFSLPYNADSLIFYCSNTANPYFVLGDLELTFVIADYSTFYSQAYNTGYDKGFVAGVSKGETIGYSNGIAAAENATFQSLFAAIIDAPVNVIASSLDFDLLGINLKTFFFSLFTIALVITIVRIFI